MHDIPGLEELLDGTGDAISMFSWLPPAPDVLAAGRALSTWGANGERTSLLNCLTPAKTGLPGSLLGIGKGAEGLAGLIMPCQPSTRAQKGLDTLVFDMEKAQNREDSSKQVGEELNNSVTLLTTMQGVCAIEFLYLPTRHCS